MGYSCKDYSINRVTRRPGSERARSEGSREREDQGANRPGSESSRERIGQGSIGRFAPGSELARERKGCKSQTGTVYIDIITVILSCATRRVHSSPNGYSHGRPPE